jgi:CRISPR-associated protein Cmr1
MKTEEERIWGSPGAKNKPGPSQVLVSLTRLKSGEPFQAVDRNGNRVNNIGHPSSIDSYAAFPLRDKQNPHVLEGVEFELNIIYPKKAGDHNIVEDVQAALWAWETFGGIGARTRRGFGALQCTKVRVNGKDVQRPIDNPGLDYIKAGLSEYVVKGQWPDDVPHLSHDLGRYKIIGSGTPIIIWRLLMGRLRGFRQSRQGFHRSKWPEPDEIRRRTMMHKPTHVPVHPVRKFPRAAFGLPIIFEFKRGDAPPEPYKTTLQGVNHERLASPLILRPIVCKDGNAVGLAAILNAPTRPPGGWLLKDAPVNPGDPPITVRLLKGEANAIEPLKNVGSETDVLLAFLKTL